MAPKYKLTYLNTTGRGEHIRYIFAYAGEEYEDYRISHDEWPALKSKTPFGKVPVLEVDGKVLTQSTAIARYLAKQFGLLGQNDWEAATADALVGELVDYKMAGVKLSQEQNPGKIEEIKREQAFYLKKFEKILADNPSGFLIGPQVTWADLTFAVIFSRTLEREPEVLKPYPFLSAFIEKINSLPPIKAWLERRPKSSPPPREPPPT